MFAETQPKLESWDDLRYLLAIARHGSLNGAARALGVNHSTVFRRLHRIERMLDLHLFDRGADGYVATAEGEQLIAHAERAEEAVLALDRAVAGQDFRLAGEVRLTTAANLAIDYVAPLLPRFRQRHPGIRLELVVSDSDYDLNRREADIALRATRSPPPHLVGRRVAELDWFVFGSEAYLAEAGTPARIDDLAGHRLIGAEKGFRRLPAFDWLHRHHPPDRIVATSNDLNTMAAMAATGIGLALLPGDQHKPGLIRLMRCEPGRRFGIWLLTHADLRRTARVRAVMDFLHGSLSGDPRLIGGTGDHETPW
jgi:DNA-binding transcriptional LysR family regulator